MATDISSHEPLRPLVAALSRDIRLYEHASEDVDDIFLAQLFSRCAVDRRDARRKLRPYIAIEAEAVAEADTASALLERLWTDLKARLLDDRSVLLQTLAEHESELFRLMDRALGELPRGAARLALEDARSLVERSHRDVAEQVRGTS